MYLSQSTEIAHQAKKEIKNNPGKKPFLVLFNYQVMIMDDGEPTQLSSTTLVVIGVQDTNDNAPEFDQKTYNVEIPSNAQIDQKLFQVSMMRAKKALFMAGCFGWKFKRREIYFFMLISIECYIRFKREVLWRKNLITLLELFCQR
jgi:hypothetical protein